MNIFTMLSSSRGSKKLTIANIIKFSNYKSSVLHTEPRVSTLVLSIYTLATFKTISGLYFLKMQIKLLFRSKSETN